jgi:purine-binding chemotaxis protein CheW
MRGAPVPVVDLGLLVGKQQTPGGRLVAIKAGNRTIALLVDEVIGIRSFNAAVFNELPPLLRDVASETVAGIGALDSEMLLMLRVARIVPEDVLSDLETAGP